MTNHTIYRAVKTPPTTLMVHCNDWRFEEECIRFVTKELKTHKCRIFKISVPGGAGSLAYPADTWSEHKFHAVLSDIRLALKHNHKIRHIAVVSHEDCTFYKAEKLGRNERRDLPMIRNTLKGHLNGLISARRAQIRLFYASFSNAERTEIKFEEVGA